jgi:rRNA maturation protein Nop10
VTETPQDETEAAADTGPSEVTCRHCGQPNEVDAEANPDWLCPSCGRYQDAMICPTCGNLARISQMPADIIPEPHAPARRRRSS